MTGPELRSFRRRLGMSQALFAQTLGISISQLHNYERGSDRRTGNPCTIPRLVELACMAPATVLLPTHPPKKRRGAAIPR
jgi:DNA-binding transcriptional regulator YiaG